MRSKGDISDEAVKDTEKAKGDFEKIRASVQALAEAIQVMGTPWGMVFRVLAT